jgi:hypothetical protein
MLGGGPLEAHAMLKFNVALQGLDLPSNACQQGLESLPEDQSQRTHWQRHVMLQRGLRSGSEHYYVAGGLIAWNNETKKRIATWLVYTKVKDSEGWNRSLRAAEHGRVGDLAAICRARVEQNEALIGYLDTRFCLSAPQGLNCVFESKPRGTVAASQAVADGTVAMFVNSNLDERNVPKRLANCAKEWDPSIEKLGTDKSHCVVEIPSNLQMGLRLVQAVQEYDELLCPFKWGK